MVKLIMKRYQFVAQAQRLVIFPVFSNYKLILPSLQIIPPFFPKLHIPAQQTRIRETNNLHPPTTKNQFHAERADPASNTR